MLRCEALVPLAVGAQESLKHADGTVRMERRSRLLNGYATIYGGKL